MHCTSLRNGVQFFFDFRCIFLKKYFADILINCIFVYQIRQIKNKNKSYENNKQNNVVNS